MPPGPQPLLLRASTGDQEAVRDCLARFGGLVWGMAPLAIGLAVAVPAVMGYNWLIRRNKAVMDATKAFAGDLLNVLLAGKR